MNSWTSLTQQLDQAIARISLRKGRLLQLLETLKQDYGCKSIAEAEALLKQWEADNAKILKQRSALEQKITLELEALGDE